MTISVSQLNNYIKGVFDFDALLGNVSVCGEITNVKLYASGWFFSIKDEKSAINCFCYKDLAQPVNGAMALIEGRVNFWPKSGAVSLYVRKLVVTNNAGEAYLKFLELKDKLSKEGLFDENRKVAVPKCCEKIGVVTSETGAVIHDITQVSLRRQPFTEILLYPVKVQGDGAEKEICDGIRFFANNKNPKFDVDVIIVGRGGGSNEDLSVFNSESIVREIASCNKPVVSAVGHNVDFTLCDFVADARAATPSEAAELVTIDSAKESKRIVELLNGTLYSLQTRVKADIEQAKNDVRRVYRESERKINDKIEHVVDLLSDSQSFLQNRIDDYQSKIDKDLLTISANNPTNILKKGYSFVEVNNKNVSSVSDVEVGDKIELTFIDGRLNASVDEIVKK